MIELRILRLAGIVWMGPKHHHRCLIRWRHRGLMQADGEGSKVNTEAEIRVTWPRSFGSHQEPEEARNRFFSKASGGSTAC